MSNILSKGASRPRKTTTLEIPEWGGSVKIRALPVGCALSEGTTRDKSVETIMTCVLADDDTPFFSTAAEVEDLDVGLFTRIAEAISAFSGVKKAEEVIKN